MTISFRPTSWAVPAKQFLGTNGDDFLSLRNEFTSSAINAGEGNDQVYAGTGSDTIWGGGGHDWLFGGAGNDQIHGDAGNDVVLGESGNDMLWGGAGNDYLDGGVGDDSLFGDAGNDTLVASGNDNLVGGSGADRFVIPTEKSVVTISDFRNFEGDKLDLTIRGTSNGLVVIKSGDLLANHDVGHMFNFSTYIFLEDESTLLIPTHSDILPDGLTWKVEQQVVLTGVHHLDWDSII